MVATNGSIDLASTLWAKSRLSCLPFLLVEYPFVRFLLVKFFSELTFVLIFFASFSLMSRLAALETHRKLILRAEDSATLAGVDCTAIAVIVEADAKIWVTLL